MKTSKPLRALIPDILTHVQAWKPHLEFNFRLYKLLEGQVKKEIEDSLRKELISTAAFNRAIQRIPSLNILKRTTDKLSKLYVEPPRRKAVNETDKQLVEVIRKEANIDVSLDTANKLYNSMFSFALEPYIEEGAHKIRVLSPHQFLVYSDSKTDKSKHTVFIKFLGTRVEKFDNPTSTKDGFRQDTEKRPTLVDIMGLYSDTEFLIIDSSGGIRQDIMLEMGITSSRNEFGRIPFVYGKKTVMELMPYPNQPGLDFSILIPKLLTDLNYAAQFCSHSMTWTKNVKLANQELNPDAIIDLGDTEADGAEPEIGVITPTVNVEQQLALIEFQFGAHLDSLGIKVNTTGMLSNGRDVSAIGKAIDEGDVSAEKKSQMAYFGGIEQELFALISEMQKVWSGRKDVNERRTFSTNFPKDYSIEYSEVKPMKSFKQKIEEVEMLRALKLATRKQAIKLLYPDWSEIEIDSWIKELDVEQEDMINMAMSAMPSGNGQFQEGNQAGANQTIESRELEDSN
jgi:hypothetical protein